MPLNAIGLPLWSGVALFEFNLVLVPIIDIQSFSFLFQIIPKKLPSVLYQELQSLFTLFLNKLQCYWKYYHKENLQKYLEKELASDTPPENVDMMHIWKEYV